MDEYADIYYVDTRNASRDHRPGASGGFRPSQGFAPPPSRVVVSSNPAPHARPTAYAPAYPVAYPGQVYPGQVYPGQVYPGQVYSGQVYPGQTALGSLFGAMPVGQILDLVAAAFAALAPLPQAPTATRETSTDVGNLVMYQAALAEHAKRDERIRTIGSLVGKLVA